QQPEPPIVRLEHDEEASGGRSLVVVAELELTRQGDDGQQPIAEAVDGDLVEDLDGPGDDADELEQVRLRDREALVPRCGDEHRDDREGEGDPDLERGAHSAPAGEVDASPDPL